MKVLHSLLNFKIKEKIEKNVGFLLTNRLGDYLSFWAEPQSRYEGWFVREGKTLYKILENLEIEKEPKIFTLENFFGYIERKREKTKELFFLPSYEHSFFYATNFPVSLKIFLDFKEIYQNRKFEGDYKFFQEGKILLIKCSSKEPKKNFFLALRGDFKDFVFLNQWKKRFYPLDKKRNSPPFERDVFGALEIKNVQKILFFVAKEKQRALRGAEILFDKIENLLDQRKEILSKRALALPHFKDLNLLFAYFACQNSLENLCLFEEKGILGGLPWFFQFWTRDEAVCLKALCKINPLLAKEIFFELLKNIEKGKVANVRDGKLFSEKNSDSLGWIFKRASDFLKSPFLNLSQKEEKEIKMILEDSLKYLLKNEFVENLPFQTWMDTEKREGPRIEIEALKLQMLKLAFFLTAKKSYQNLEKKLKRRVRAKFWNGKFLKDGIFDKTTRPNIFLAAYIYPELLRPSEWQKCFENALKKLYLSWGGLSTIEKNSPNFSQFHTGEDPQSYHRGDSWFYLNNMAALLLFKFGKEKFKNEIEKILKASQNEILFKGVISHHGELSSAKELSSEGCWAQAWSSALFLEAIDKIYLNEQ